MDGTKRKFQSIQKIYNKNDDEGDKVYRFNVLLPNGINVPMIRRNPENESISLEFFVDRVKEKCSAILRQKDDNKPRRRVFWESTELYLEDVKGNKFRREVRFDDFVPNKTHLLKLFVSTLPLFLMDFPIFVC